MKNILTVKQVEKACKEHPYVLFRLANGFQVGINSKIAGIARKKRHYNENDDTSFLGYVPCDFMEYISCKIGFITIKKQDKNNL